MLVTKGSKVDPFWAVYHNPTQKIGHNQKGTTLEPRPRIRVLFDWELWGIYRILQRMLTGFAKPTLEGLEALKPKHFNVLVGVLIVRKLSGSIQVLPRVTNN